MNSITKSLAIIVLLVFISNLGFVKPIFNGIMNSYEYRTSNNEFSFVVIEEKGRDIPMMTNQFNSFLKDNLHTNDTIVFRTFKKESLKFWNWHSYFTDEKYKYPLLKDQ